MATSCAKVVTGRTHGLITATRRRPRPSAAHQAKRRAGNASSLRPKPEAALNRSSVFACLEDELRAGPQALRARLGVDANVRRRLLTRLDDFRRRSRARQDLAG